MGLKPRGVVLDRKAARKQMRQDKKQQKASSYQAKRLAEKQAKRQAFLASHPQIAQQIQARHEQAKTEREKAARVDKQRPIKKRRLMMGSTQPLSLADVHDDL